MQNNDFESGNGINGKIYIPWRRITSTTIWELLLKGDFATGIRSLVVSLKNVCLVHKQPRNPDKI